MRAFQTRLHVTALRYDALSMVPRDRARGCPCLYCWAPMDTPTWDHVIPLSKGGPNNRGNLVVVCRTCNASKDDMSLPEYEGVLGAIGSPLQNRLAQFSAWLMSDWDDATKAEYARIVAHSWAEAVDVQTHFRDAPSINVRNRLSQLLKRDISSGRHDRPEVSRRLTLVAAQPSVEAKPYTLRDLRRGR